MAEKKRASDFEKLGVFYLGREYSLKRKAIQEDLLLYDSKDLTTHAVCVGMTGSGKTGLCLSLLEEAAIDGIPAIIIDPKGDMPNLMLTFPQLRPEDFLPWVSEEDARKKGQTPEAFAAQQAEAWAKGLADWMQSGKRIERLRKAADVAVYTPGSTAGLPVSILQAFDAPAKEVLADTELLSERIQATVASLLGLLGIEADPVQSREHILLSTILGAAWSAGAGLDLAGLIQQVQRPPMQKIGVLDLESFYPEKERFNLVLALNNLLAAPGFGVWLEGAPLDIARLLHNSQGKPQLSIFSIAHLSDTERMFFVTLLLTQVLSWVRAQPGTSSLRAILYMDELFGYLPPVAQPPSKKPLLTLLKQARASGLGVVLATQNPVDLDYKALSNTGTWFIGRLQTERDKQRVMEALEGWAAGANVSFKKAAAEQDLAGLSSRVFLMHNVHEDGPVVFHSRWALSYLAGPMTREQIKRLMRPGKDSQPPVPAPDPGGTCLGRQRRRGGHNPCAGVASRGGCLLSPTAPPGRLRRQAHLPPAAVRWGAAGLQRCQAQAEHHPGGQPPHPHHGGCGSGGLGGRTSGTGPRRRPDARRSGGWRAWRPSGGRQQGQELHRLDGAVQDLAGRVTVSRVVAQPGGQAAFAPGRERRRISRAPPAVAA